MADDLRSDQQTTANKQQDAFAFSCKLGVAGWKLQSRRYSPDHKGDTKVFSRGENRSGTHNLEVGGASPSPATKYEKSGLNRTFRILFDGE